MSLKRVPMCASEYGKRVRGRSAARQGEATARKRPARTQQRMSFTGFIKYNPWIDPENGSIPQMRRLLHGLLGGCIVLPGLAAALSITAPAGCGHPTADTPTVSPVDHKSYSETIPGSTVKFE